MLMTCPHGCPTQKTNPSDFQTGPSEQSDDPDSPGDLSAV